MLSEDECLKYTNLILSHMESCEICGSAQKEMDEHIDGFVREYLRNRDLTACLNNILNHFVGCEQCRTNIQIVYSHQVKDYLDEV